ncbi:nucleotidyltransferase domain-containing protein [Enterococcus mundtii]|uniref:Nucleotidyltransferase domain-containing protein n=1 Tax=Enterococcus mundtii TaxID=53346 RepID=A0AAI8R6X8_ENTMU|nr:MULTISPECIES: nucleotidyltransferase domain-containing protein [Enterococcus]BBM13535.1 nucleotidyltransferase domain-containing protein [Enterococcus mundtii]
MVLTVKEIEQRVKPVAEKYEVPVVYIFGSYARNEATNESDIDFLVGTEGMPEEYRWLVYSDFFEELKKAVDHEIDLVEIEALANTNPTTIQKNFTKQVMEERLKIFEK